MSEVHGMDRFGPSGAWPHIGKEPDEVLKTTSIYSVALGMVFNDRRIVESVFAVF